MHPWLDSRPRNFPSWIWTLKYSIYSQSEVFTFGDDCSLWARKKVGLQVACRVLLCQGSWPLFLSFPFSTVLQTRWCAPASHAWRDCPPALLPLARGDICGGCSHCGPDHLRQEPGSESRSHEEAQVLVEGRRFMGSKAQKLHPSAHISLQSLLPGAGDGRGYARSLRGSSLDGSGNRHSWKTRDRIDCMPCVVAMAKGSSS